MKAILEFNLPEEQEDLDTALKAGEYRSVLWEIHQYIRKLDKYGLPSELQGKSAEEVVAHIRQEIYSLSQDVEV